MWVLHRDVIPCSPQTPPYLCPGSRHLQYLNNCC